jgi:uncharacterized protein involved in exopolysaccharide biosynthesis/Mrp family chromosome partitioning ATPase
MAVKFALENVSPQPGHSGMGGHSRSLVPLAPSSLGLSLPPHPTSAPPPHVDQNPYLATAPPQFTEGVISMRDILGYLKKRGRLGLFIALPISVLVFYVLGMGAKVYEAEAKLRLRLQDANVFNFNEMGRTGVTEISAPMLVNNHLTEIKSRRFVDYFYDHFPADKRDAFIEKEKNSLSRKDQLLNFFGLYKAGKPGIPKEIFAEGIGTSIRVEPQKESHILRIQVRNLNAQMAADIANKYAEEYIRFVGEQESNQGQGERVYLQKAAEEQKLKLEESERKLNAYRQSESLMQESETKDVDAQKVTLLNAAITDAQLRLTKAKNDLQIIRSTQQAGRDLLEVRVVADNPEVAFNRKELDAKNSARKALEPFCGRRHPQMIALAGEIQNLRSALDRATSGIVTMTEAEVTNQERQIVEFQKQLDAARGQAMTQSGKNVQQNMLRDQVAMDRELYQKITIRLNQADITGQFKDSGALSLSDIATTPEKPVKPNKPIAAVASLLMLGFLFVGIPVGWGLIDDHVLRLLRQGGSPSPHIPPANAMPSAVFTAVNGAAVPSPFSRLPSARLPMAPQPPLAAAPVPLALPTVGQAPVLARLPLVPGGTPEMMLGAILQAEPHGAAGALQQITTTLEKQALTRSGFGGIILLTSAEAGEGKTLAAAALAATFCNQGRSVFMMECNAVSPTLHQWFPQAYSHSSWAHDLEALRYGNTNLFLLPAHDLPAYATNELLDGYRTWLDRARHHVDWIILDGGPILRNFADVAPLAPLATDVLIVNNPAVASPAKLRAAMNLIQPMMSSSALRGLILHGA